MIISIKPLTISLTQIIIPIYRYIFYIVINVIKYIKIKFILFKQACIALACTVFKKVNLSEYSHDLDNFFIIAFTVIKNTHVFKVLVINSYFCLFLYYSLKNNNSICIYLYKIDILLIIGIILIALIAKVVIKEKELKTNHYKVYKIIRILLLFVLCIVLTLLVYYLVLLIISLASLLFKALYSIFIKIFDKKKSQFSIIKTKFKGSKPPKGPNNSAPLYFTDKNKKVHKDITKKALEMKNKIIEIQNNKFTNGNNNVIIDRENSLNFVNKKWNHSIIIEDRQELSSIEQLERLNYEYKAYDNQTVKFQKIVDDINKGKEKFYPNEAKSLFKEYIEIIKKLKVNIKSMENNLKAKK